MTMVNFHNELVRLIKAALESGLSLEDISSEIAEILGEAEDE